MFEVHQVNFSWAPSRTPLRSSQCCRNVRNIMERRQKEWQSGGKGGQMLGIGVTGRENVGRGMEGEEMGFVHPLYFWGGLNAYDRCCLQSVFCS